MWKRIEKSLPLKDKLIKYQSGFLIRMATCEGVGLFSIVGLLLSNNLIYLVVHSDNPINHLLLLPAIEKLELHIDLNQTELDELKNDNYHQHGQ